MNRRAKRVLVLGAWLLIAVGRAGAQTQAPVSVAVPATGLVKTGLLTVSDVEQFRLEIDAEPGAAPEVVPYVYDETQALVCRDDPEVVVEAFTCRPPKAGRYYFVLQNLSPVRATARIMRERIRPGPTSSAEFATVRVFYATTRQPATAGFGAVHSERTSYGHADVSIPRDHRMGELEGPAIWRLEWRSRPERHVMVLSIAPSEKSAFFQRVAQRVRASEAKEALVFVHGFNVSFDDATRRAAQIAYDLGFSGAPILFSWPSLGELTPVAYQRDERNAEVSAEYLYQFLDELAVASPGARIHVIAHSMGNLVLSRALDRLSSNPLSDRQPRLEQVALVAPDVDAALFRQIAPRIASTARRVTLYASSEDLPIRLSGVQAGARRAGEAGDPILVVPGVDTVDASAVRTGILGLMHSYYADNTTLLSDLFALIRGRLPRERFGLTQIESRDGVYWRFRPSTR